MKTKEEDIIRRILSEFPELASEISDRYYKSSSFLEVCEDYIICLKSIDKLKSKKGKGIKEELNELNALLIELKEEILSK